MWEDRHGTPYTLYLVNVTEMLNMIFYLLDMDEYYTVQQLTELSDPLLVQNLKDSPQQMAE